MNIYKNGFILINITHMSLSLNTKRSEKINLQDLIKQLIYDISEPYIDTHSEVFIKLETAYKTHIVLNPEDVIKEKINISSILSKHYFYGARTLQLTIKYESTPTKLPDFYNIFYTVSPVRIYHDYTIKCMTISLHYLEIHITMPNINNLYNHINQYNHVNTIKYMLKALHILKLTGIDFGNTIVKLPHNVHNTMKFLEKNTIRRLDCDHIDSELETAIKETNTITDVISKCYGENHLVSVLKNCPSIEVLTLSIRENINDIIHSLLQTNNLHTICLHLETGASQSAFLLFFEKTHINNVTIYCNGPIYLKDVIISPNIYSLKVIGGLVVDDKTLISLLESNIENDFDASLHVNDVINIYDIMIKYSGHRMISFVICNELQRLKYGTLNLYKISVNSEKYSKSLVEYCCE